MSFFTEDGSRLPMLCAVHRPNTLFHVFPLRFRFGFDHKHKGCRLQDAEGHSEFRAADGMSSLFENKIENKKTPTPAQS